MNCQFLALLIDQQSFFSVDIHMLRFKTLNFLEKQRRVEVCEIMLSEYQDKMECIITGDETWIYAFDPETTDQSSEIVQKVNQDRKDGTRVV